MNTAGDYCHPYLRTNFQCTPATQTTNENCLQKDIPCGDCCLCYENKLAIKECERLCDHQREQTTSYSEHDPVEYSALNHCIPHECPREKEVYLKDCCQNILTEDKDIIKASGEFCSPKDKVDCRCHQDMVEKEYFEPAERPCCAKITSWTEPRICRCDPYDTTSDKRCECECGSAIRKHEKKKVTKNVRFADEVTYVDCDKEFQNLEPQDVKELCRCCKACANQGKDVCIGKPVMVYELPEPKLDDTSVTRKDYHWHKTPQVEVPPWHPNIKDRWYHLDVPSIKETTYQCDFKPPPAAIGGTERDPVYLAPQREKKDPCQELAQEYSTWKKTSDRPKHMYHSSCDSCDKDLQRLHLHECETAHLPPQYKCHGDGHICDQIIKQCEPQFTLCEKEDNGKSRYWWQRTCCLPEKANITKLEELPADLKKPACPSYTTIYKNDFKSPKALERERLCAETCTACEYCTRVPNQEAGIPLCTRDPNQPFITQKGGVIG